MIETTVKDLTDGLGLVGMVIDRKAGSPLQSHVLISYAAKKQLQLSGSGVGLTSGVRVAATIDKKFPSFAVDHKRLISVVSGFKADANVKLTLKADKLEVKSGRSKYNLLCMSGEEFPQLPKPPTSGSVSVDSDKIAWATRWCSHAMSIGEDRAHMEGADLTIEKGSAVMHTVDGKRCARCRFKSKGTWRGFFSARALSALAKVAETSEAVTIARNETAVFFWTATAGFSVNEPHMPKRLDYTPMIADVGKAVGAVAVRRALLLDALGRLNRLGDDSGAVELSASKTLLKLVNSDTRVGDGNEQLPITTSGEKIPSLWLDWRHLYQSVKAATGDVLNLYFWDARSQIAVVPVLEDVELVEVIMPIGMADK